MEDEHIDCETPDCEEPARFGDKCLVCTREAILQRREEIRMTGELSLTDEPICSRCNKKASEISGAFSVKKGMCRSCCIIAKRKAGEPVPHREMGGGKRGDDPVKKLLAALHASLDTARKSHQALKTIKELTGADIDIPEINF